MTAMPPAQAFRAATAAPAAAPAPPATGHWSTHWFWAPLGQVRGLLGQVALAALLVNLLALATTLYSVTMFNRIIPAGATGSLVALTLGMLMVLAFEFALRSLRGYFTDLAASSLDRAVGARLFTSVCHLPHARRQSSTGALAGLVREFETLREFSASASVTALADLPFLLLYLGVIALIAPPLALVPALAALAIIGLALATLPLQRRLTAAGLGEALSKQAVLVETIAGLDTAQSSRATPLLARRWTAAVHAHAALSLRQRLLSALPVNASATAQSLVYVLSLALGVALVESGQLTLGALIAASMLAGRTLAPLAQAAALATRFGAAAEAYRALDALIASADAVPRPAASVRVPRLAGHIQFEGVRFTYPGSATPAIDGLDLDIQPGERVAIVGRTGSGKSTINRLLCGLHSPDAGAIRIDGHDLRALHPDDLHASIGTLLQDVLLFSGTIAENLRLDDPALTDADLLAACRLAGADQFISRLPQGHDTRLADRGLGLSGGQRQSLALARALIGPGGTPRPILLLDEPTSALDLPAEAQLIDRLAPALQSRTLLMVTHRPSALRLATRILHIEAGRIIADGPREPMLHRLGLPPA